MVVAAGKQRFRAAIFHQHAKSVIRAKQEGVRRQNLQAQGAVQGKAKRQGMRPLGQTLADLPHDPRQAKFRNAR
jgi:hypothetical protein